jgi:hypothetical protein
MDMRRSLLSFGPICRSMPSFGPICRSMLSFGPICRSVLSFGPICRSVLSFGPICRSVLSLGPDMPFGALFLARKCRSVLPNILNILHMLDIPARELKKKKKYIYISKTSRLSHFDAFRPTQRGGRKKQGGGNRRLGKRSACSPTGQPIGRPAGNPAMESISTPLRMLFDPRSEAGEKTRGQVGGPESAAPAGRRQQLVYYITSDRSGPSSLRRVVDRRVVLRCTSSGRKNGRHQCHLHIRALR